MHSRTLPAAGCLATACAYGTAVHAADVVIGVPNRPSVLATAHVLEVAMEDDLGLEVELRSATDPVVFEAMDSGSMHVHPGVWLPNQANLKASHVDEKG